jgi:hypothetical protein
VFRLFPSRIYPAPLAGERFEVAVERNDRFARRARIEVPVALPDECGVGPPCLVGVTKRFRNLERIGTRGDHERGEGVAEVVEFESGELFLPARLCIPG